MDNQSPFKTDISYISNNDDKKYCINCGKNGHISKKCLCPIISIGIVCVKFNIYNIDLNSIISYSKKIQNNYLFQNDEICRLYNLKKYIDSIVNTDLNDHLEYLLIKRRNSLNYVEFIRGKYNINNLDYLIKSFNFFTENERMMLKKFDFEYLWKNLWGETSNFNNIEFKESKEKFDLLKKGCFIKKNDINIFISINKIIDNIIYNFMEPEWGFPKGRRNLMEKNIECAKREFEEETLIKFNEISIINMVPLEETYIASNSLKYKHIYYISQMMDINKKLKIDSSNIEQNIEIGDIRWFNFKDALSIIRPYNIEKKNILVNLHYSIKYIIENFKELLDNFFRELNH